MFNRTLTPFIMLSMAGLMAAGCGQPADRSGHSGNAVRYAENGTFTMAVWEDLGVYDPYRNSAQAGGIAWLSYDSLINQMPNGEFVSGLAQKWSADARSATFMLRPGITCSDGTPLTAMQVADAITYVSDPKNQSPQYGVTVPAVPLTATGDDASHTVKIVTKRHFGFLLNTIGQFPVMCKKGLENPGMLKSASAGTGPFVLTEMVPGQYYKFAVRKGYSWGPGGASTSAPGTPSTVIVKVVSNKTTAANLLLAGDVNFAEVDRADRQRLDARGLPRVEVPAGGAWLWLNQLGGRPLADIRVRQALVSALDLSEMVKISTGGVGTAATGLTPKEPKACPQNTVTGRLPRHDVAAAETLLDQAGWRKGSDGIRSKNGKALALDLHFEPAWAPLDKTTAELLAQRWHAIGIKVNLVGDTTMNGNRAMFQTSNYDVFLLGFNPSLPTILTSFVSGATPPKGKNLAGINNSDYNALADKAETMVPPAACTYWNQAEYALFRDVDVVPISNRPWLYYLKNAQAQVIGYKLPVPTSIRVLK